MRKTILFIFMSVSICSFAFAEQLTITTYYPAPFGVYRDLTAEVITVLNNNEQIVIGNDANNPAIEFRDLDGSGNSPYIDFSNSAAGDYDMRIILTGNNALAVTGGTTTFTDNAGNPATIKTGEVWFCADY